MAIAGMQQTPTALCGHILPTPARLRAQRLASRTVRVRAEEQQGDGPRLSFKPSQRAGLGYTDEDSAGQQNIFAVEPRQYMAGSSRDNSAGGVAPIILVAGALGISILGLGLLLNGGSAPSEDPATDGLSSLSEYSRKFAAEVGGAPPLT